MFDALALIVALLGTKPCTNVPRPRTSRRQGNEPPPEIAAQSAQCTDVSLPKSADRRNIPQSIETASEMAVAVSTVYHCTSAQASQQQTNKVPPIKTNSLMLLQSTRSASYYLVIRGNNC